jgi:hypothetical protein
MIRIAISAEAFEAVAILPGRAGRLRLITKN